jgi:hypothetical protein
MPQRPLAICVEVAPKKTFASALDWPGWARAGRDEAAAIEALAEYADRYAPVARAAGITFPASISFTVVERLTGTMTTQFGAPDIPAAAEFEPMPPGPRSASRPWSERPGSTSTASSR